MAASLLRIGRLGSLKCVQAEGWNTLRRAPAASATFCTKSDAGGPKKPKKSGTTALDPIQKLFLDSIRDYSSKSKAAGGMVDAGAEYQKALSEELIKLQRLYGGGDLTAFPEFKFTEPKFEDSTK